MPVVDIKKYQVELNPTWCPGCGDYGLLRGLQTALAKLDIDPSRVVIVSGIGCSSNLPHFIKGYGYHSLHGRSLPTAQGIKMANPDLLVIAAGGDGDGYGIGVGHFVHACRRNLDITYVVMNNQIYGLTTGQTSPTSDFGSKTKSSPDGNYEFGLNPILVAIASGATFVARTFSGEPEHMSEIIAKAIQHRGFALVDDISPCVTYNKKNTYQWFKERIYKLEDVGHNPYDISQAMQRASEWEDKIPIGIFYINPDKPSHDQIDPVIRDGGVVNKPIELTEEQKKEILQAFL
ncbi:MAG: thiamine pyrophosphate-dependent enzyme [Spirochaetia bacterium]|nr:thiamine pyrophosphate-dependent enzyme [Spirochaetota bacterium]MCX8095882.1 thiamine pyrophosphate-dependent enzyme [Spirochaetota bacterium]MDW8112591.1 thiamine pyrophosphate-dependent enzyme [Spirochaetia bacterium]